MNVIVDQLATSYTSQGVGSVLLCLHGWGDKGATFTPLVTSLEKHCQVVCLDLPGFGATEPPKHAWGLDDYAKFVADFLAKTKLTPQVIIGHSNGAAIAIRGLATELLRSQKLIVLGGAGVRSDKAGAKQALKLGAKFAKAATFALPGRHKEQLRRKLYQTIGSDYLVVPGMEETFKKVVSQDVLADAKQITLPTLLVYGSQDEATPVSYGKLFAQSFPNATLQIIDNAGHFLHQTHAPEVAKLIEGFAQC